LLRALSKWSIIYLKELSQRESEKIDMERKGVLI
jgi:hypothetical protein